MPFDEFARIDIPSYLKAAFAEVMIDE